MSDTQSKAPKFIQLHVLTSYPPSNPNRDDLGQPKSAFVGGTKRQRISSQSLKRAWRTSDTFKLELDGETSSSGHEPKEAKFSKHFGQALEDANIKVHPYLGARTKNLGIAVKQALLAYALADLSGKDFENDKDKEKATEVADKQAQEHAESIAHLFGDKETGKGKNPLKVKQLFLFSPAELKAVDEYVQKLGTGKIDKAPDNLVDYISQHRSVDIALYGRMLAKSGSNFRDDGSVQVAHAVSVHEVEIEDDYFTAVDDFNSLDPDAGQGSGFLDTAQFGASLYYLYVCIDRDLLLKNLTPESESDQDSAKDEDGNGQKEEVTLSRPSPEELIERTIKALVEAMVKVTPSGKRAPFGHHTYAHYVLAERGYQQPRGLHIAFLNAIRGKHADYLAEAREALETVCCKMDRVYGACAEPARYRLDFDRGYGKMDDLKSFVTAAGAGNWTVNPDKMCPPADESNEADATEAEADHA